MRIFFPLFLFLVTSVFVKEQPKKNVETTVSKKEDQQIKLMFVGDIMGHGPQIKSAEIIKEEVYDYRSCFKYVRPILQEADLAIGNLEVTLPGKPPYHGWPNFRSPDDLADGLWHAGFDLLTTSNNHSNDAGKSGVINTIKTLKEQGFYHTGTYQNALEKDLTHPLIVYKKGFKLAFLNYTYGTDLKKHRPPTIVNLIDPIQMRKDLRIARRMKADAIIVMVHWGREYEVEESSVQRKLAMELLEWGADLVIGGHPHVVQPIVEYPMKNQKGDRETKLVSYSLGNFISNQKKKNTDGGIILEIDLIKNQATKKTQIKDHHYIPVWRYIHKSENDKATFYTIPIAVAESEPNEIPDLTAKNKRAMMRYATFIREHLGKSDCPERKIKRKENLSEIELSTLFH